MSSCLTSGATPITVNHSSAGPPDTIRNLPREQLIELSRMLFDALEKARIGHAKHVKAGALDRLRETRQRSRRAPQTVHHHHKMIPASPVSLCQA